LRLASKKLLLRLRTTPCNGDPAVALVALAMVLRLDKDSNANGGLSRPPVTAVIWCCIMVIGLLKCGVGKDPIEKL